MSIPEMGTAGSEPHLNTPGRPSESATDIHSSLEDLMNALAGRHDVDDDDQPAYAHHTRAAEYSISPRTSGKLKHARRQSPRFNHVN